MMENANSRSLGTDTTLLFFPSHTFSLLHSNRLTNVPWKFTLDAGSRESKRKVVAAGKRLHTSSTSHILFFFLTRAVVY